MRRHRHPHHAAQAGFTLLELLLVLGVLVLMTTIAWPSVSRALDGQRLTKVAERVRIEINATRTRAIETGVPYQFLYEGGGGRFVSIPTDRDGVPASQGVVKSAVPTEDDLPRASGLMEGFEFSTQALDPTIKLQQDLFGGLDNWRDLASLAWSGPVKFDSDGSGEDVELTLYDRNRGQSITLKVRGFTGAVTIGSIEHGVTP